MVISIKAWLKSCFIIYPSCMGIERGHDVLRINKAIFLSIKKSLFLLFYLGKREPIICINAKKTSM